MTSPGAPQPAAARTEPSSVVCRKCWHSLKGIPSGSVCPECGNPAEPSGNWWGNAPARLFTRAAAFSLVLAAAAGLMVVCGSLMVFLVTRSLNALFSGRSATSTERAIVACLPPVSLCVVAAFTVAVIGCSRNLASAGMCGVRAARVIAVGAVLALIAWTLSVAEDVGNFALVPGAWIASSFGLGGTACLTAWSSAHVAAARGVGGAWTRALSWVQFAAAVVLFLATTVSLLAAYSGVSRTATQSSFPLAVLAQDGLPYMIAGVLCVLALNAVLLRAGLRRFAAARAAA